MSREDVNCFQLKREVFNLCEKKVRDLIGLDSVMMWGCGRYLASHQGMPMCKRERDLMRQKISQLLREFGSVVIYK